MANQTIRSTKTYIWYLKDVLGTGATSTVYLGRHKKTGDVVAVKMFNHMSYMRPHDVQRREFEVLLKLNHKNIIHLHCIEEDQISKQEVIVMEICTGGSLYTHLDTPENLYGLKEDEFLRVLKDVSAGMKHLRDNGIIHRDIKPGNIMMVRSDNGVFIYKLADFGAARELEEDENFESLYGTEEYLHPDLYERAVLGKRNRTKFTAQTDLWSLGVTIYQTATGALPFRAHGGRSNREIMHKITTTKKSGIISGVQEVLNGPIVWSEDLPKTCHLSPSMRQLVRNLLVNTMDCDMSKMWTFDRFFSYVQYLVALRPLDVFVAPTCESHRVHLEPSAGVADFQASLAHLTGIQPDTQCLMWEREVVDLREGLKCDDLPPTATEKPMILLRMGAEAFPVMRAPALPIPPKTATHYSVQQDCSLAKTCAAVMCFYFVMVTHFCQIENLITETVKSIVVTLKTDYLKLQSEYFRVTSHYTQADCKMQALDRTLSLLESSGCDPADLDRFKGRLNFCHERGADLNRVYEQVANSLEALERTAIKDDYPSSQWEGIRQQHLLPKDRIGQLKVLSEDGQETFRRFKKDKQNKQLSYNEEQIHRMDKDKLGKKMQQAGKIYEELLEIIKKLHSNFGTWHGSNSEMRCFQDQVISAQLRLKDLPQEYSKVIGALNKIEEDMSDILKRRSGLGSTLAKQRPQQEDLREKVDVMTSMSPSMAPMSRLSQRRVGGASTAESLMMSVQQLINDLPLDSLGMVPIPRSVKQTLNQYEHSLSNLQKQLDTDGSPSR